MGAAIKFYADKNSMEVDHFIGQCHDLEKVFRAKESS
jgi:hypothetical protein